MSSRRIDFATVGSLTQMNARTADAMNSYQVRVWLLRQIPPTYSQSPGEDAPPCGGQPPTWLVPERFMPSDVVVLGPDREDRFGGALKELVRLEDLPRVA